MLKEPTMLPDVLAGQQAHLAALAEAWLGDGATSVSVWTEGCPAAYWPAEHPPAAPTLRAPITMGGATLGDWAVEGLCDHAAQARLHAEASLLSQIAQLESDLESMTVELVDYQDQLLALYDLAQSARSRVGVVETLESLSAEAARIVKTGGAFVVLQTGAESLHLVQSPAGYVDETVLMQFWKQLQASGQEVVLPSSGATEALPGISNLFAMPIEIRGRLAAGLGLFNRRGGFVSPDLKLARAIGQHMGAQLENILLYQENIEQARLKTELDLAANMQLRLLPRTLPRIPGLDISASSRPALQVGGDFYDFMLRSGQPLVFSVGDVTGKGMAAALFMSITHTVMRNAEKTLSRLTPEDVVSRVNEDLYDDLSEAGMFVTAFVGHYHADRREVLYANAGHSPVIYCPSGEPARLLEADGTALGVLPISLSETQSLPFDAGDLLVVATDGFSEASCPAGELFGYDRLLRLIEAYAGCPAAEIGAALFDAVHRFADGRPQDDDQTLVVIKAIA